MSANFYELLKYAATGQASPDMTYYDRMRASTLMGGVVQTLTGQPPLTFKADGKPLISWSMKGNGSQHGTPTPDNPVMPDFVGVRTVNLFYSDRTNHNTTTYSVIDQTEGSSELVITKNKTSSAVALSVTINLPLRAGTYTVSIDGLSVIEGNLDRINLRDSDGVIVNNIMTGSPQTFTIAADTVVNLVVFVCASTSTYANKKVRIMLNSGSTALPYEPYGWAEKITCAGQTVPVYLGEVPTVRRVRKLVLDGTEDWALVGVDYIHGLYIDDAPIGNYEAQICSHFIHANSWSELQDTNNSSGISSLNRIVIHDESVRTSEDFKAFLAQQYAAGNPVTIWYVLAEPTTGIVNEPLCKISTYADELHSEDASVTIPTAKGQNTLTVDTPIQPSEMTIIFKG